MGKHWTDGEVEQLRSLVGTGMRVAEMARKIGKSYPATQTMICRLGLVTRPKYSRELLDRIRELNMSGLNDSEISKLVGRCRRTVTYLRSRTLKLKVDPEALMRGRRAAIAKQAEVLGIKVGGELKSWAARKMVVERGWPETISPRHVQILEELAVAGRPLTKKELSERLGYTCSEFMKSSKMLRSSKTGLMSDLVNLGLVVCLRHAAISETDGKATCNLYTLSPESIRIIVERAERADVKSEEG